MKWPWAKKVNYSDEAEFDIVGLEVFSVERDVDTGDTIISFFREETVVVANNPTGVVRRIDSEWWVHTNDNQHREFVRRLAAKIAKRERQANADSK